MTPRAYRLATTRIIRGETFAEAGATVYDCMMHDYGGASDDTRLTDIEHVSVTLDPAGGYPFFTVPKRDLLPARQLVDRSDTKE